MIDHFVASSIQEALAYLAAHRGQAQVMASGKGLVPKIERGEYRAEYIVDISHICALKRLVQQGDMLVMGGCVSLGMLSESALVQRAAPLLYEAAQQMANSQVCAESTLAGTIVAAQGSTESSVALVALGAQVEITNLTGSQWLPLDSLFVRYGVSQVDSTTEIITAIRCPTVKPNQGAALERLAPSAMREEVPFVLALLAGLKTGENVIESLAVAVGWAKGVPSRLREVEGKLVGKDATLSSTCETFVATLTDRVIERGVLAEMASEARRELLAPLARRAFERAINMAVRK